MILIIGSGVAGLAAAIRAREKGAQVLVIHRGWCTGSTHHAQGGIAAALLLEDSPERHLRDTLESGQGLADPRAVELLVREGPALLQGLGLTFYPTPAREGGHSLPRIWHTGHDRFGLSLQWHLRQLARQRGVRFLKTRVLALGLAEGEAVGAWTEEGFLPADAVILATGGYAALYDPTTNPPENQGEGLWMALHAGAVLRDLELVQFHPTWLYVPPDGLISETVRGAGAVIRNTRGEAFMPRYHPMGDLAPRDVVTRAILQEMAATGADHVILDLSPIPEREFSRRFPHTYRRVRSYWPHVPVRPAAHYSLGGVVVNAWGETGVPRLFAAGEVAWTGVHGANRLGSNSLLEGLVWGTQAGERASLLPPSRRQPEDITPPVPSLPEHLRKAMDRQAGALRRGEDLQELVEKLPPSLVRWVAEGALLREESRGVHLREDFPTPHISPYHLDLTLEKGQFRWQRTNLPNLMEVVG